MIYIISYDLNKSGQDYNRLYNAIKSCSTSWCHYLDSTWLIDSSYSTSTIQETIRKCTDNNDLFVIMEVTRNYSGWLPQKAWDWIHQHLGFSIT